MMEKDEDRGMWLACEKIDRGLTPLRLFWTEKEAREFKQVCEAMSVSPTIELVRVPVWQGPR